ncbi:uncharacterized protein LOC125651460 [Ostrea edulis]|uniref:uncharacterized protein LOC125651460 n=1 Tax=Ostrea edulis TaxID=37623 RepID=UPI0024AE99D0|nr:uncharacterized protein LOC125651460 [Ostrea edulis]
MKVIYLVLCLFLLLQDSGAWLWGSSKMTFSVCNGQNMNLRCMSGQVIKIRHATYGCTWSGFCCKNKTAKKIAEQHCNKKAYCRLRASDRIFGSHCRGSSNCLTVTFSCNNK